MEVFWIYIILVITLSVVSVTYFIEHRRLYNSWDGLVQGKKIKECFYKGNLSNIYLLQILKDNGERLTLDVEEGLYKSIEVGDRVKKEKGQYYPNRNI